MAAIPDNNAEPPRLAVEANEDGYIGAGLVRNGRSYEQNSAGLRRG